MRSINTNIAIYFNKYMIKSDENLVNDSSRYENDMILFSVPNDIYKMYNTSKVWGLFRKNDTNKLGIKFIQDFERSVLNHGLWKIYLKQ